MLSAAATCTYILSIIEVVAAVATGKVANRVKKSLKAAAAKKSFLLFGSLGLHNLSNGVEEAPRPRIDVIAEAEINTTQIPNASEAKF